MSILSVDLNHTTCLPQSDCLVPLEYSGVPDSLRGHFQLLDPRLTDDFLARCRTYLTLARHLAYSLQEDIQKVGWDSR